MAPEHVAVTATFPSPGPAPRGLAWDGVALWHADGTTRTLYRIDARQGHVLAAFPVDADPRGLAWDGQHLWLADNQTKTLRQIDPASGQVGTVIPLSSDAYLVGTAWTGQTLLQGHYDGVVREIDRASGHSRTAHRVGEAICGMAWAEGDVWYVDDVRPALHRISARTWEEMGRVALHGDAAGLCAGMGPTSGMRTRRPAASCVSAFLRGMATPRSPTSSGCWPTSWRVSCAKLLGVWIDGQRGVTGAGARTFLSRVS